MERLLRIVAAGHVLFGFVLLSLMLCSLREPSGAVRSYVLNLVGLLTSR